MNTKTSLRPSLHVCDVEVRTANQCWVIPFNCKILKALLAEKNIRAGDLRFSSDLQCHEFIKRLFLLAAEDECCNRAPSELAGLARDLIGLSNHQANQ